MKKCEEAGDNEKSSNKHPLQILDKNSHFIKLDENRSLESAEGKSVTSLNSLRERLASRSANKKIMQLK